MSAIPEGRIRVWEQEGRSPLWQALVRRLHGAAAVDNHALSIADAERLADAALDEIGKTTELAQLRRWLRACSLGRATKEIHAEIRAYLAAEEL